MTAQNLDAGDDATAARGSIARRMLVAAAAWSLAVLLVAGWSLQTLYRAETNQRLDESVQSTLLTLANAVDSNSAGEIAYADAMLPNDERYKRAYSGAYWAYVILDEASGVVRADRSRSFFDSDPEIPQRMIAAALQQPDAARFADGRAPDDVDLRFGIRAVRLPERSTPILLYAAIDRTAADDAVARFAWRLGGALAVLAIGLVGGILYLIRYGLRPLRSLQDSLSDVRSGRRERLEGDYPEELAPLVHEINTLVKHNRQVVERARTQVGNLAHALKTPLAVLRNEAEGNHDKFAELVTRQTEAMRSNVEHYLKRAQAAAQAEVLGARTPVKSSLEGIARMLERLHRDKGVAIDVEAPEEAVFRGERGDLDDLVGNLLENAAKWCRSKVRVRVDVEPGFIVIVVDDDGSGLAAENREQALQRGKRLDESAPGTGLGLSIVTELAEIYGGHLQLEDSPMGGLRARLQLPAAAT